MSVSKWWQRCWLLSSLTWVIVGFAQARPVDQQATANAGLDQLQANLAKQFPEARPVELAEGGAPLQRALDVTASGHTAYAAASKDFEAWCKHSGGVQHGPIWPNDKPNRADDNTAAIGLMYRAATAYATSDLNVTTCLLGGRPYALASGTGAEHRILAWFGPDDAAGFVQAARAEKADARRRRKAEEERLVQEKVTRFLSDSVIGTQTSCVADQLSIQTPPELTYRCGLYLIPFADFNRFGWRITSQSVVPQGTGTLNATSRVTLLVEKVR